MIEKIKTTKNLPLDDYVNHKTGETLDSEVNDNVTIQVKQDSNLITISSSEYIVFDSNAMMYICDILSRVDVAKVFEMSNMLKTDCSVLFQGNNKPHTTETLSLQLEFSLDELRRLIKRLVRANILAYAVSAPSGYTQKIYMLNPFLARKRKTMSCELLKIFSDISKKPIQDRFKKILQEE